MIPRRPGSVDPEYPSPGDSPALTRTDAWHLNRFLAGTGTLDVEAIQTDLGRQVGEALVGANGNDRHKVLDACLGRLEPDLMFAVVETLASVTPDEPEPAGETPAPEAPLALLTDCPPLPRGVALEGDDGPPQWLEDYICHASAISPMTPRLFHESAGLWLVSTAIARRIRVPMSFGDIYPNLMVVWLAQTTLFRKTTALDVARTFARRTFPHLLMAQDSTPEAMIADLAGLEPHGFEKMPEHAKERWRRGRNFAGQRGWLLDEMSGLLSGAGRDYNAGQIEMLLRLYDCDPDYTRSTRSQGHAIIRNAYLSLLGASTPAAMAQHLEATRLWAMGLWPRCAILTPEGRPEWKVATDSPEPPTKILNTLDTILNRLPVATYPDQPAAINAALGDGVFAAWERYNKAVSFDLLAEDWDERLAGTYGRLPTQLLKVAAILAALDWPPEAPAPRIEMKHLAAAMRIVEAWRANVHRALTSITATSFDQLRGRLLRHLAKGGRDGLSLRDLRLAMRDKTPDELLVVLQQLATLGDIEVMESKPGPKGGRPTERFRLATE